VYRAWGNVPAQIGTEHPVEHSGRLRVAQDRAGLVKQARAVEPFHVEGQAGEVVARQVLELATRIVRPTEPGVQAGEHAAEHGASARRLAVDPYLTP
jgi:hypothetical protein